MSPSLIHGLTVGLLGETCAHPLSILGVRTIDRTNAIESILTSMFCA